MKKFLFMIIISLAGNNVFAEWVFFDSFKKNEREEYELHVDVQNIRKNGELVKMWNLNNYAVIQEHLGYKFLSEKVLREYDCTNEMLRTVFSVLHKGSMGSSIVVYTYNAIESDWLPAAPNTIGDNLLYIACGKFKIATSPHQSRTAKWQKIYESASYISYLNLSTLKMNGRFREAWKVLDFSSGKSISKRNEYDCYEKKIKYLESVNHTDSMGSGTSMPGNSYMTGTVVPARSSYELSKEFDLVCGLYRP